MGPVTVAGIEHDRSQLNVVGPQIRKLRNQKGWTQAQLAQKLQLLGWDTSRQSVARLETQERRVTDLEVLILAMVLGVKTDELYPRGLRSRVEEIAPEFRVKLSRGQVPPA